jgi:glutamine synthetase
VDRQAARSLGRTAGRFPRPALHPDRSDPGADNPHLLQAAVLAAGLDGIERKLDPGPRSDTHTSTDPPPPGTARPLPSSLAEALTAFGQEQLLHQALGESFSQAYDSLAPKRSE